MSNPFSGRKPTFMHSGMGGSVVVLPTISVHPMYIRASACTNVLNVCSAYVGLRHHHQRVRDHAMCRFGFTNRIVRNSSFLGQRFLWTERHRYGKQQHARVRSTECANWCSCSLNLEMGIRRARNPILTSLPGPS